MTDPRLAPYIQPATASHAKFFPRGPFISITLAQGILESNWFTRTAGHNNFFGIKATQAQIMAGESALIRTREWNGRYLVPQDLHFATYATPEAAFDAHATLLCTPHYLRCQQSSTPADYARALQACGYATAPNYAAALIHLMASEDLYAYDHPGVA